MVAPKPRGLHPDGRGERSGIEGLDGQRAIAHLGVAHESRVSRQWRGRGEGLFETRDIVDGDEKPTEEGPDSIRPLVPALRMAASPQDRSRRRERDDQGVADALGVTASAEADVSIRHRETVDDPDLAPGDARGE